jgi:hypothetical protein
MPTCPAAFSKSRILELPRWGAAALAASSTESPSRALSRGCHQYHLDTCCVLAASWFRVTSLSAGVPRGALEGLGTLRHGLILEHERDRGGRRETAQADLPQQRPGRTGGAHRGSCHHVGVEHSNHTLRRLRPARNFNSHERRTRASRGPDGPGKIDTRGRTPAEGRRRGSPRATVCRVDPDPHIRRAAEVAERLGVEMSLEVLMTTR